MKKRVRIYKPADQWRAQMGGVQAAQAAAPQAQLTDEDLISATVQMLAKGSQPQEVLNTLMQNGIEQQKATQAVQYSVDYIKATQEDEYSDVEADEEAQQNAALEQAAAERQAIEAQEEEARNARMKELYGLTDDSTAQDYSDDDEAMMDMMRYGGLPSKRTFVKNAVKLAKKQMGGQEQQMPQNNRADNTDTGDRQAKLQKFVGSLQNHANEALMKQEAEEAYNQMQMMQPQMPFMPMAQEGGQQPAQQLTPRQQRQMARQQRQMGRQMNRMIGNIPVGLYNNRGGGLPTNIGVINMPAIGTAGLQSLMSGTAGLQNYLPSAGSIMGGPKLANIDVRKTGLFGRPKQYSITFAQDVVTNPTTAENAAKQEIKNIEEEAKDTEEKISTAAEEVKKADEAVKAEETAATKSSSGTKGKSTTKSTSKTTTKSGTLPAVGAQDMLKRAGIDTSLEAIRKRNTTDFTTHEQVKDWMRSLPTAQDQLNYIKSLEEMPAFKTNKVQQDLVKYLYANVNFHAGKPGLMSKDFMISPALKMGPQSIQSWDDFWLTGVTGGANALVNAASKPAQITFKTIAKQLPYSGTDVRYSFQQGGMTDEQSGLYKFVYGGNDMYEPPIPGKITDDPYFQYGGYLPQAEDGIMHPDRAAELTKESQEKKAATTAKTPDYSINPMTGKAWTDSEWALASKLLGTAGTQATTSTDTSTEDTETADNQSTSYNYGYNTGVGPIYPPMFGRGRGLQNLLGLTPYGANPLVSYAGTWTKQKGLPIDPATGQAYTGDFANPQIAKIDVRKSSIFGRPKKYSIDYMVDDVAGTSSFLKPEDYPGGVNPGPGSTTTPAATTADGLTLDPATGEPLPVGREIKNLKLKSFMSKIPGVRNMINWGDAPEMTPEEEADFKYKSEIERNMAAEERGDIVAPPLPEENVAKPAQSTTTVPTPTSSTTTGATTEGTTQSPTTATETETPAAGTETSAATQGNVSPTQQTAADRARTNQVLQMQQNIADERAGDLQAPLPPGERQGYTADERSFLVERNRQPMLEGLPEGTPEEIRNYFAQQKALSPSSFAEYQAGPMQNVDAEIAQQFGVPQSMVDQFAYQNNMGDSGFDLSTQQGFDRQQYLNEALGREQLDVSQRPTPGSLTPNSIESFDQGYGDSNIIQSPQSQADYDRISAELIKQGKPVTQQNIMQQFGMEQAGAKVREQQAATAPAKKQVKSSLTAKSSGAPKTNYSRTNSWENNNKQSFEDKNAYIKMTDFGNDLSDFKKLGLTDSEVKDLLKSSLVEMDKRHPKFIDTYYSLRPADRIQYIDYIKNKYGAKSHEMAALKALASGVYTVPKKSKKYGGLYKAYDGVQTPVSGDPRFASNYEEMMRNIADEEAGLLVPPPIPGEQAPGMRQIEFGDVEGVRQNAAYSDKTFGTNYTEDYGLNKPGRKKVTVNYKNKNMWTIDPLVGVNTAIAGAQGLTRFLNTRDERKREKELAQSLTADNVYGSRSNIDRGTYDVNSGLFRQDQMGFTGVARYGGSHFKEGGTTYMSAAQVKKFLEEGGELEFV